MFIRKDLTKVVISTRKVISINYFSGKYFYFNVSCKNFIFSDIINSRWVDSIFCLYLYFCTMQNYAAVSEQEP